MRHLALKDLLELSDAGVWGEEDVDNGISVLRSTNFRSDGRIDFNNLSYRGIDEPKRSQKILSVGDILLEKSGGGPKQPVGRVCLFRGHEKPQAFGNFLSRLRPRREVIEPEYLFYRLWQFHAVGLTKSYQKQTSGIRNLETRRYLQLPIWVPPLPEQRRIIDLLSRAENIVRMRKEAEAKAKEIIPSLFLDMFGDPTTNPGGWEVVTIGELIADGPQNGLYKHADAYGSGVPILRIDGFYDGAVKSITEWRRLRLEPIETERFALRLGDIVVNRVNSPEYLGKSAIIPPISEPAVYESNMMRFAVNLNRVVPEFIIAFLQTGFARTALIKNAKHAINQSSINQGDVKGVPIYAPPISMQLAFRSRAEQAHNLESQQSLATKQAEQAFQSLLARVFQE